MNTLLNSIIKNKTRCVFISPHEDDALLSCGSLIAQLSGKTDLTVVNIFTKAHKSPYTLSARKFLHDSGFTDAQALYEEREREDAEAFSSLTVKVINLGLEDALFRKKKRETFLGTFIPEIDHVYPTYQWHITKKIASDDPAVATLEKKLEPFKDAKNLIFAPCGIGNHVDHMLARKVSAALFDRYVLYSDFPYNVRLNSFGSALPGGEVYRLDPIMKVKTALIKAYHTQFHGLFTDDTIPNQEEIYYSNTKL